MERIKCSPAYTLACKIAAEFDVKIGSQPTNYETLKELVLEILSEFKYNSKVDVIKTIRTVTENSTLPYHLIGMEPHDFKSMLDNVLTQEELNG